ncbi:MAG: hypothetical protein J6I37_01640 [Prevotella sp.]|nr:hypothetical protein [Prevotella sp.]
MKKLFTLLTLALMSIGSAWADEETSPVGGSSNADLSGTSFTINGTTNAGSGTKISPMSDKGIKVRKNYPLVMTVKPGYKITGVTAYAASNDNSKTFQISKIEVDGVEYVPTGKTMPITCAQKNASEATTISITDISATDNITFTFDGTHTQGIMEFHVTYEATATITKDITAVKINGTEISASDLATLKSTQALTNTTAFETLPSVQYTETTYADGSMIGTEDVDVSVQENEGNYVASFTYDEKNYTITFDNVNLVTVFDAAGQTNAEIILSKTNVTEAGYLEWNGTGTWNNKKWEAPYDGEFLDMKSGRTITLTVKNVTNFEIFVNGFKADETRTYTVKVGDGEAKEFSSNITSGFVSSGLIETGTSGEITITLEGGSSSLYPAYIKLNSTEKQIYTATEYSTYVTNDALDFTGLDIEAYVAKAANTEGVVLEQVTSVPANTPLILKGIAEKSYFVPFAAATHVPESPSVNLLKAGDGTTTIGGTSKYDYVLNKGKFYRANEGTVAVGKAYLHLDAAPEAHELTLIFGDDVTGIQNVKVGTEDNVYYDLQGRRVLYPKKGLYIVNGKKVILK